MKDSYVVIGCGRFGNAVAKTLYKLGHDVLAIDNDMNVVEAIADDVTQAAQGDATDENTLRALGVQNYDTAIISITANMESSIITTILVKELGIKNIICKAKDELQGRILTKIGADRIVYPERDMGEKLAGSLVSKNVLEFIDLDPSYSIAEITVVDLWVGRSLIDLALRSKFGLNVIAIKNEQGANITPNGDDILQKGDILVVVGENSRLSRIDDLYE